MPLKVFVLIVYMKMLVTNWDKRYLDLAEHVAGWSKDPTSKIGAVAVNPLGNVLSMGYNGFPRGIDDTEERLNIRETKYALTVHAEMNAIYNAALNGVSLSGSTLYVYGLPVCADCAKGVLQSGIKRVVMRTFAIVPDKWIESWQQTAKLFDEVGVYYTICEKY